MAAEKAVVDEVEQQRRQFAEEFGLEWELGGAPRMEGRVLGYLMIMNRPFISSAELAKVLSASAGSVSMSTRRLVEAGYIRRHVVAGDRSHYFRTDSDLWGSFLAGERKYLDRQREIIEHGLSFVGEDEEQTRKRLTNARDYMVWLASYHRKMLSDWEAYKVERNAASAN